MGALEGGGGRKLVHEARSWGFRGENRRGSARQFECIINLCVLYVCTTIDLLIVFNYDIYGLGAVFSPQLSEIRRDRRMSENGGTTFIGREVNSLKVQPDAMNRQATLSPHAVGLAVPVRNIT